MRRTSPGDYPTALVDELTDACAGTVMVSDRGRSGDEYLVDRQGQAVDPAFVGPDRAESIEAGVREVELICDRRDAEDADSGGA